MSMQDHIGATGAVTSLKLQPSRSRIGAVRDLMGVTARAIRHYEQLGMIECVRDGRNIRTLDEAAMERLVVIRDLRLAGTPVPRIAEIVLGGGDVEALVREEIRHQAKLLEVQHAKVCAVLARWSDPAEPDLAPHGRRTQG